MARGRAGVGQRGDFGLWSHRTCALATASAALSPCTVGGGADVCVVVTQQNACLVGIKHKYCLYARRRTPPVMYVSVLRYSAYSINILRCNYIINALHK